MLLRLLLGNILAYGLILMFDPEFWVGVVLWAFTLLAVTYIMGGLDAD